MAALRRALHVAKAGHAGTLDPGASGLLIVALGSATRLLEFLPIEPKVYRFGILFGSQTDTLDMQGAVVASGGRVPDAGEIESLIPRFTGTILQAPPEYSAIKVGGVRSYRRAREGRPIELAPRPVTIFSLRLLDFDAAAGRATFETACSGGTYIRALARDIAKDLGTLGSIFMLRRIAAGHFHVDTALCYENIHDAGAAIIPVDRALDRLPSVTVSGERRNRLFMGHDIGCDDVVSARADGGCAPPALVIAYDDARRVVAVLRHTDGCNYHPEKVFRRCD